MNVGVRFGSAFYAGGAAAVRLRQAQVVYTLTQFPTVSRIRFVGDGQGAGTPVGRGQYADLLPPVVVLDPVIGQRVTSPITVAGTADVFEATVNVRLLDAAGRQIATRMFLSPHTVNYYLRHLFRKLGIDTAA